MIIGQTIHKGTYYSPWFQRRGNAATFVCEVIAVGNSGSVTVNIKTKNTEDVDPGSNPGGGGAITISSISTANTLGSVRASSLLELVRFEFVVTGGTAEQGWVHLRMLPPSWEQNGA